MSYPRLVDSHKGQMQLEDGSTLVVSETDEETGDPVQVRWKLKKTHETEMSTVFLATNEQRGRRIMKRITSSKLSENELGALVWLNAVCGILRACKTELRLHDCSDVGEISSSNSTNGSSTLTKCIA